MRSRSRLECWEYMPSLQYSFVIQVVLHYWQDITLLDLFYLMSWKRLPHALLTNRLNRTSCCDVRNAIECAHGRLKARYPVLSVSLNFKLHEVPVTIITCFVLRNWWEDHGWKICTFFSSGRPRFTYLWERQKAIQMLLFFYFTISTLWKNRKTLLSLIYWKKVNVKSLLGAWGPIKFN